MGRGGRGRGGGGRRPLDAGEKLTAFFDAIRSEKVDTINWSLRSGGLTLASCNEDGRTGLIEAAAQGKCDSLEVLLRVVRDCRDFGASAEALNAFDEDGKTATMAAVEHGHLECIRALVTSRARLDLEDCHGQTVFDYAAKRRDIIDILDDKARPPDEAESESEASDDAPPGETGAQRRKRKKQALSCHSALKPSAKRAPISKGEAVASPRGGKSRGESAVLQEVAAALASSAHELLIEREGKVAGLAEGELDPAIWRCQALRRLQVRFPSGLESSTFSCLGSLRKLQTLIIRDSGLTGFPDVLGSLSDLRSLDIDKNNLVVLPASLAQLGSLESLSANNNSLASAAPVATLGNLQSLALSGNQLKTLDDLCLEKKTHLTSLRVANNSITELPDSIGELLMMQHFDVSGNQIAALPLGLGRLKEKKLTEMILDNNPIRDGKIRNMIERSAVLSKDVLTYLRKQKPSRGKKGQTKQTDSSDGEPGGTEPSEAPESAEDLAARVARQEEQARDLAEKEAENRRLAEASKKAKKAERRALEERMRSKMAEQDEARERTRRLAEIEERERAERRREAEERQQEAHGREEARRARMSPEECAEEDAVREEARLQSEREAAATAERRAAEASEQAGKNEEKARQLSALSAEDGIFKFVFHHGAVHKVRIGPGPNTNKKLGGRGVSGAAHRAASKGSKGDQKEAGIATLQEGELEVPAHMIGRLIGTGGAMIKELCSSTGAKINVKRGSEAGGVVPVAVSGTPLAVDRALKRIGDLLSSS